jgi:hypothetical protein
MIISFNDDIDGWLCFTTRGFYCERIVDDGTLETGIAKHKRAQTGAHR